MKANVIPIHHAHILRCKKHLKHFLKLFPKVATWQLEIAERLQAIHQGEKP